jgi:hypothetical protein
MDRLRNPFTPGAGALPPELAGRSSVIEDGRILAGRSLLGRYEKSMLLLGLRGVGKTVLLKHLAEDARQRGVVPIVAEIRDADGDFEELALRIKAALDAIDFASGMKTAVNRAFSVLRNFVKTFSLNVGEFGISLETTQSAASSGRMELDLCEVLLACSRAAKESGKAIGLYIDELQNLRIEAMRGIIVALHFAAQESLPLYLVGSGLPSIRALVGKSKTYAERMFNYAEVGALSEADVDLAITIPLNNNGIDIESEAISEIYRMTQGYPYFLQEYGYQIWNAAKKSPIAAKDVELIEGDVRKRLDSNFFDVRFDRISGREMEFLRTMSGFPQGGPIATSDIAREMNRSPSAISPIRASLVRKGIIYAPAYGGVAYTVPMFADYLKRTLSPA